jgi:hypothetical protein
MSSPICGSGKSQRGKRHQAPIGGLHARGANPLVPELLGALIGVAGAGVCP